MSAGVAATGRVGGFGALTGLGEFTAGFAAVVAGGVGAGGLPAQPDSAAQKASASQGSRPAHVRRSAQQVALLVSVAIHILQ